MNTFTLPIRPKSGNVVKATDMENHARAIEEIQNALIGDKVNVKRRGVDSKPPFWPILSGNDTDGFKLRMIKGWIVSRHMKYGVGAVLTIEVTAIPGDPDPDLDRLAVASGDKIWCKVTESEQGEASAGVVEKGTTWPESDAPKLIGGDDQTGADGTRYVRLCEIVTVDGSVKVKVLHTGHIDHFAPALVENTTLSPSTNEARVLKVWNSSAGRWDLRYLEAGDGIEIEELTDSIKVSVDPAYVAELSSHPWKVIPNGDDTVDIFPGVTLCVESEATPGLDTVPSFTLLKAADFFNGSTVTVTGAGYIVGYSAYGVTPQIYSTSALTSVDAESVPISTGRIWSGTGITVEFMAALPAGAVTGNFYFIIAEVSLAASVAVVNRQWITHNPTLDTYFADGT